MKVLDLHLVPLADFREVPVDVKESLSISWTKDGEILGTFTNKTSITIEDEDAVGRYIVDVKFATEEVRVDRAGLLTARTEHIIDKKCAE